MNIFIDNKSGAPIYEQIFTQLKSQIISGTLPSDEALPSIRSLAKDLRISVVTTKRLTMNWKKKVSFTRLQQRAVSLLHLIRIFCVKQI